MHFINYFGAFQAGQPFYFVKYLAIGGDYVVFDGNNYTITLNTVSNYPGLFQNGNFIGPVNGYSNITVKSTRVFALNGSLINAGGWIGQGSYGFNATNIYIDNCHTDYPNSITGNNSGGIVGRSSPATVTNCTSSGPIPIGRGGICGKYFSCTVSHSALLSWSTTSEQNTHNFEVQHSIRGNTWNTIGTVAAKGNNNVTTTYNYSDLNPVNGNNYYRLKQTDIDEQFDYSIVRNLRIVAKNKTFSLLNNPVSNGVLK